MADSIPRANRHCSGNAQRLAREWPASGWRRQGIADLAERATAQSEILKSTPGTAVALVKKGRPYRYWRVYDAAGRRVDRYLGAQDDPATEAKLGALRERIAEARALADASLTLRKQVYCAADNSAAITLAALFNAGVFGRGAMLVGTHAFGAILNSLGVRIGRYQAACASAGVRFFGEFGRLNAIWGDSPAFIAMSIRVSSENK